MHTYGCDYQSLLDGRPIHISNVAIKANFPSSTYEEICGIACNNLYKNSMYFASTINQGCAIVWDPYIAENIK